MGESPIIGSENSGMDFGTCIERLLLGKKMRRLEWKDGHYLIVRDEKLMIFTPSDKQFHPLTVSTGDMMATDWVVAEKEVSMA